ncbi:SdpI family protein [Bacillus mojavensis]|uniref:SdpI family protein n=1 Tax=Bacillus mojavensis TaxID=72360 RepID=UPI002DB881C0|nr:SdpI family protein [Bacillus mojavensis]MEC1748360.1 SdpI family protein [Bacillus mojavensis]
MACLVGGGLMIIAGLFIKLFPPKSINSVYGFRTRRSMSDQRLWDEANRYSAALMILSGLIVLVAGVLLRSSFIILQLIMLIAACIITFMLTEKRLKHMTKSQGGELSGRS